MNIPTTSGQPVAKLGSAQSAFHAINSPVNAAASPQTSPASSPTSVAAAAADPVVQLLHQFRLQQQQQQPNAAAAAVAPPPSVLNLSLNQHRTVGAAAAVVASPSPPTTTTKTPTSPRSTKMYTPQPQAEFFAETMHFKNDYANTVTVTSAMTSPQILENPQTPSTAAGFLCQICSDRATGKHYGASSCDGCKGFFRRTIRKQQEYKCRFAENCVIDKDKRNTCRFCRFQKCVNAGMMRNAVQSERDSISVKRKRSSSNNNRSTSIFKEEKTTTTTTNFTTNVNNNNNNNNFHFAAATPLPQAAFSVRSSPTSSPPQQPSAAAAESSEIVVVADDDRRRRRSTSSAASVLSPPSQVYGADHVYCPPVTADDQLAALKQAENLFVRQQSSSGACTPNVSGPSTPASSSSATRSPTTTMNGSGFFGHNPGAGGAKTRLATVEDLADSIKEQLLLLVEWAKALPPFIELSLDDQVSLLRSYSAEHLLLGVARRSLPYRGVLLLSNDACIPRHHSSNIHDVNHVVFRILDELVEPMRELQLDDTEIGCLKALLFFNPNASGLVNKLKVKETRQQFLTAFHEYVTTRRSSDDKVRFGSLLLLLPPLQAMSQQFVEDLQLASLFGIKTFDKLLEELLLATASSAFLADGINAVAKKFSDNQQVEQNGQLTISTNINNNNNNMIDLTPLDNNISYSIHHHHVRR